MNKTCFALTFAIVAISFTSLFAGETMVTRTTVRTTGCHFKVDKCETSVATDPSYLHFQDGPASPGPADVGAASADPDYTVTTTFQDYPGPQKSIDELLALIQEKLNKVNCPKVTFSFDKETGDITIRYVHTDCGCECKWTLNIRNVTANDFVWARTTDNYSDRLGQMERRKYHTANQQDAIDIQAALARICVINGWSITKV